jgi:hypothetical protein
MALFLLHIMTLRNLNVTAHLFLPEVHDTLFFRDIKALRNLHVTAHLILPEVYGTVPLAYHGTEEPQCHGTPHFT